MGDIFDARYLPIYATTVGGTVAVTYYLTKDWVDQHFHSDHFIVWYRYVGWPATALGVLIGAGMTWNG